MISSGETNASATYFKRPATERRVLVSGSTAIGSSPVAITTTWTLTASRRAVTLVGYFSGATAALTDGAAKTWNANGKCWPAWPRSKLPESQGHSPHAIHGK